MIQKVKLFVNNNEQSTLIANKFKKELTENGFEIVENDFDLAIAIGGDGSFLRMVKNTNFNSEIYYIGINTGTLGFLQEIKPNETLDFIAKIKSHDYNIEEIGIQETTVTTKKSTSRFYSLNEIVIREKDLNTSILDVHINDAILERFIGDGLLISTSVGSTAYNLSFGGSIVYNSFHTLQITPIAPLNNKSYRNILNSIVLPEDQCIKLMPTYDRRNIIITIDGENSIYNDVEKIVTVVNGKRINCLRLKDYNFINIVNDKFLSLSDQ